MLAVWPCCWSVLLAALFVFARSKHHVDPRLHEKAFPLRAQTFREIYGEELPSYQKYSQQGGPDRQLPNRIRVQVFPRPSVHPPRRFPPMSARHTHIHTVSHGVFGDNKAPKSRLPVRPRRRTEDTAAATIIGCPRGVFRGDRLLLPLKQAYFYKPVDSSVIVNQSASNSVMQAFQLINPAPKRGKHDIRIGVLAPPHHKVLVCHYWYNLKDIPRCPSPAIPKNGHVTCNSKSSREYGCLFSCEDGYHLSGKSFSQCLVNGSWSHPTPSCQPTHIPNCPSLAIPKHGNMTCNSKPNREHVCLFTCRDGYHLSGESISQCLVNGSWSHPTPSCQPTHSVDEANLAMPKSGCPEPPSIPHGLVRCVAKKTKCRYDCRPGFVVPTSQLPLAWLVCKGSSWNVTAPPQCKKQVAPKIVPRRDCAPRKASLPPKGPLRIRPPRFRNSAGRTERGRCDVARIKHPGRYRVECHSWDHELRVGALCRFSLTVTRTHCSAVKLSKNEVATCNQKVLSPGTKCRIECREGFEAATHPFLDLQCDSSGKWQPGDLHLECIELVPPKLREPCHDQTYEIEEGESINLPLPEFYSGRDGSLLNTACTLPANFSAAYGNFTNVCQAKDPTLNTTSSCSYNIHFKMQAKQCPSLIAPANSHLTCSQLETNVTTCLFTCKPNYHLPSTLEYLVNQSLICDSKMGRWNFQLKETIDELPDCVRNLPTTVFQRATSFKGLTSNCSNQALIGHIIKKALLKLNEKMCSKIECSNFTQTCESQPEGPNVLTVVWTLRAVYEPTDDGEEYIEAEANIEAIQAMTNTLIKTNESFNEQLKENGLELLKKSFQLYHFILICQEGGFFVEESSQRCMECPRGTKEQWGSCIACDPGWYQDESGQVQCKPCPSSDKEHDSLYGARSLMECSVKAHLSLIRN